MPDPDREPADEMRSDPRFDNWPAQQAEAYEDVPFERETPGDDDFVHDPPGEEDVEYVGFFAGPAGGYAFAYEQDDNVLYEGEYDRENERFVHGEEHERRELESTDSIGEHVEAIGEEHDWTWLSSFAREHLEDEEDHEARGHFLPPGFEHRDTEFQRRNVAESADADVAFFGSHTLEDAQDRVHVLEREFGVADSSADSEAAVSVVERYLVATEPREETRAGDADLVDENEYEFTVDADPDERGGAAAIEEALREWHDQHIGAPVELEDRESAETA